MLSEDGQHLHVSHDEYQRLIERLALQIHRSGWAFDRILCLARGGLRAGDILSRIFELPLAVMSTSSYRAGAGTVQGSLQISDQIASSGGPLAGRVLLVDDLADSGQTLRAVVARLRADHPAITELRSAVIWTKACSAFKPDYSAEFLPTSPWIHQPFEAYDSLRPQQLAERLLR